MGFLDPVKGFGVTFGMMFKKVATEEYPEAGPPRRAPADAEGAQVDRRAAAAAPYPVPPMDLSIPPSPRLRAREPVSTVPATDAEVIDSDDPHTGENR